MRAHRAWIFSCVLVLVLTAAPAARASFHPGAQIVSASLERLEQADGVTLSATISADARYVAFQTRAKNLFAPNDPDPAGFVRVGGVFRRDLTTAALELVADGDLKLPSDSESAPAQVRGAANPSISADGRYVVFSTGQKLVPVDTNDKIDVYMRDMTVPIRSAGAFELISARDGGDEPATYGVPAARFTGADVSRGAAISADGSKVVFKTTDYSDLPNTSEAVTEPYQLFVRDRQTKSTTLVTRRIDTGAPAGGADRNAGISADGTTVAWAGQNAPAQTRFLLGETRLDTLYFYLWRRIADGPDTPTKRITGEVDPDDPGCAADLSVVPDQTAVGPCYGPLTVPEGSILADISSQLPALSADGNRVAFLTGSGPRPNANTGGGLDVYLTDMGPGVSRKAGTLELTRDGLIADPETGSPIAGLTMSADGRWLALATNRTSFVLPTLRFVGTPATLWDFTEIYVVDLDKREIERAVRGLDGTEVNGAATSNLSLSEHGERVTFVSSATNLFPGDANERPDAFVATRQDGAGLGQGGIERIAGLSGLETSPSREVPRLLLRVKRVRRGGLRVSVEAPGPGVANLRLVSTRTQTRRRTRLGGNAVRRIARARIALREDGQRTVVLRPPARQRRLLHRLGRMKTRLIVTFSPRGGGRNLTAERLVVLTF